MGFLKSPLAALPAAWMEGNIPHTSEDDNLIKDAVGKREKMLRRTAGLSTGEIDEFGRGCLLACQSHVVTALETADAVDLVGPPLGEPEDDPASYLRPARDHPHSMLGAASILYERIAPRAEQAARIAKGTNAFAGVRHAEVNAKIDVMTETPSTSWADASEALGDSFVAGIEADQAARRAYQLGSITRALRVLVWGSQGVSQGFRAYGAAKGAVCAVVAAANAASARAFVPGGDSDQAFRRLADEAALAELQTQARFLGRINAPQSR